MKIEHIGVAGDLYLTKVFITSDIPDRFWPFKWRPAIHIFSRPDLDRVFHDHPWNFTTVVLWGGYEETAHELDDVMVWYPGSIDYAPTGNLKHDKLGFLSVRRRFAQHAHRITRLRSRRVVTLIFMGPKHREWGFWHPPVTAADGPALRPPHTLQNASQWVWEHWRNFHDLPHPGDA